MRDSAKLLSENIWEREMGGYEETHWAATENEIAQFRKTLSAMPAKDRATKVMTEIAIQLMWLNAHLAEIHDAVHRIADNQ
jgi:hypothetical protein